MVFASTLNVSSTSVPFETVMCVRSAKSSFALTVKLAEVGPEVDVGADVVVPLEEVALPDCVDPDCGCEESTD